MTAYYNEFNPEAAAMLRQLIAGGHCAPGDVDERSITEVKPDDLKGYTQCHFFAGIGGWSVALRLAGWPDDKPVWTGSAPCQPFSAAGAQKGKADERHLAPCWLRLIAECRPQFIYGEQVAAAVAHGWLDDVFDGLEAQGYACGAAVLPACSVGAPHRRDRLWFVAHSNHTGQPTGSGSGQAGHNAGRGSEDVAHAAQQGGGSAADSFREEGASPSVCPQPNLGSNGCGPLGDAQQPRLERHGGDGSREEGWQAAQRPVTKAGFWDNAQYIACHDGKLRAVEPSIPLLVNGFQHRRPLLHALGNAIVPQLAAQFIQATLK